MRTSDSNSPHTAVDELQQNQEQYNAYFEANPDSILVHDDQGNITDANAEACRVLGYAKDELLSKNIADLEVGLEVIASQKDWASFLKSNSLILQRDFRKKDNSTFAVEVHYRSFEKNGDVFYECTLKDVSERNLLRIRERNRAAILEQLAGFITRPLMAFLSAPELDPAGLLPLPKNLPVLMTSALTLIGHLLKNLLLKPAYNLAGRSLSYRLPAIWWVPLPSTTASQGPHKT